jgi:hypothetical protein
MRWTNSMAPAVFIDIDLEAFGHARLFPIFRDVAPRAAHAGGSAAASLGSTAGMGLANPTAIVAEGAFDHWHSLPALPAPTGHFVSILCLLWICSHRREGTGLV